MSDDPWDTLASAEFYEPVPRKFTRTDELLKPRSLHSATVLPGGAVLLAGGDFDGTAELYDPGAGKSSFTGRMTVPRGGEVAALLRDGPRAVCRRRPGPLSPHCSTRLRCAPAVASTRSSCSRTACPLRSSSCIALRISLVFKEVQAL